MPSSTSCSQAYASTRCAYLAAVSWSSIALWSRLGCSRHITYVTSQLLIGGYVASPLLIGGGTPLEPGGLALLEPGGAHGFTFPAAHCWRCMAVWLGAKHWRHAIILAPHFPAFIGPTQLALVQHSPIHSPQFNCTVMSPQMNCTCDWQIRRTRMKDIKIHNGLFILIVLRIYMATTEGRPNVTLGSVLGRGCDQDRPFPRYLS